MPRVSVIIPTYNRSRFLEEAILSVVAQTFEDWELIVVDDGSTDDTAAVAAKYADRLTYKYQDNAGACVARNLGLTCASGEFVTFLDSDDRMLPNNLQDLVALLDKQPQVDVAYGWYYWMEADGGPSKRGGPHIRDAVRPSPWLGAKVRPSGTTIEGHILPKLLQEETILLGAVLARRACIDVIGGFDPTVDFNEHWHFFLSLARAGFEYACCRQVVALIRLHAENRGQQFDKMLAGRLAVLDRFFNVPDLSPSLAKVRGQSYYLAYLEYARAYFADDEVELGANCLNEALKHRHLRICDLRVLTALLTRRAMASARPDDHARLVTRYLAPGTDSRFLRRKLLGKVHAAIAREDMATHGIMPKALWHCLLAICHDPARHRAEEVARIVGHGVMRTLGIRIKPMAAPGQLQINT